MNMATTEVHNKIHQLALDFLADSKNYNKKLAIFLAALEGNGPSLQSGILGSQLLFCELLRRCDMRDDSVYKDCFKTMSVRACYYKVWDHLIDILHHRPVEPHIASEALTACMKFISLEGQYPLDPAKKDEYFFPALRLKLVLTALVSSKKNNALVIALFQEYSAYPDVLYNTWKLLFSVAMGPHPAGQRPNETFIRNFLDLIDKVPLPKPNQSHRYEQEVVEPLCGKKPRPGYTETGYVLNMEQLRKFVNKVWGFVMHWEHTPASHKLLLVVLLERILPFLDKPLLLTDYLMDSLDMGGPISLLALQGLYVLIQNHNLEYPNIFDKLYSMFEPEIFHTKCKARLCYLSNEFLSSTHLPGSIVAAFAKRLARLCLVIPPEDAHILIQFLGNLLLRHPVLKKLIDRPLEGSTSEDPFVMEERDPTQSGAMESSLWELQSLQQHALPSVATAARFINNSLPSVEWDMNRILEETSDDLFDRELKKKAKELSLALERSYPGTINSHQIAHQFWQLR